MKKKLRLLFDVKVNIKNKIKAKVPEKKTISFLLTSHLYCIDCVFILRDGFLFHLVVNYRGRVLTLKTYRTLAGTKAAFKRLYRHAAIKPGIKNKWSHFYPPDKRWLKRKMTGHH